MKRDLHHNIKLVTGLVPQVFAATANTAIVDTQGFLSQEIVVSTEDFTYTAVNKIDVVLHESDDAAFAVSNVVAVEDLLGANISLDLAADAPGVFRQGYLGVKRYLRATLTVGGTVSAAIAVNFIQGHPVDMAVAEQDATN